MNKLFETKKAYDKSILAIAKQCTLLGNLLIADPTQNALLQPILEEKKALLELVAKMKTWNFNFKSGGWNSINARTKEEAVKVAKEQYNETEQRYHSEENGGSAITLTEVDENSFRVATPADTAALCSNFY
jgi:hypothetical protein